MHSTESMLFSMPGIDILGLLVTGSHFTKGTGWYYKDIGSLDKGSVKYLFYGG